MRLAIFVCFLITAAPLAHAKHVKTPKSTNARADFQSHKAHGKHVSKKVKTRRSKQSS